METERFLVSRTDRAGDLILTLPVFRELKKAFPHSHLVAHVRSYTAPLVRLCKQVDSIILDDDYPPGLWSGQLTEAFKAGNFDCSIMVHPTGRALLAAWKAGIGRRIGRASNIFQVLLNDRRVQKRSRNEKHEFQYNLDLLTNLAKNIDYSPWHFNADPELLAVGQHFLAGAEMFNCRPVIVHPGHGGSAHNIPTGMYVDIVKGLLSRHVAVIVSLGPGEESLKSSFPEPSPGKLAFASSVPDLAQLAGIFSGCSAFCGGSTGPLHLAAALELSCVAFFPPVAAMTPLRWGPAGCKSLIIKPNLADCHGKCGGCKNNGCMNGLNIQTAVEWLTQEFFNVNTLDNK
jgi:ADP-heptose:LPS heptosyltransferase